LRSDTDMLKNLFDRYGIITFGHCYSHGDGFHCELEFKHIVKRNTILATGAINLREGYKPLGIFSPMEVIEYAVN
jgi:hypothetical protein